MTNSNTSIVRLSLTNFKSHESLELKFPRTGLWKIDGVSGKGKTNILKAIIWCLWGTGSNVIRNGAKKCRVELENLIPGYTITREKPNKLSINGDSDGEMQAKIIELLGMNETEFELASYLQSEYKNALVFRTPAEQLELFSTLAGFKNKPDVIKAKTEALLDEATKALKENETAIGMAEIVNEALEQKIQEFSGMFQEEVLVETMIGDLNEINKDISNLENKIKANNTELADPVRALYQKALDDKPGLEEKLNESIAGKAKVETELAQMNKPSDSEIDALKTQEGDLVIKFAKIKADINKAKDKEKLEADFGFQKNHFKDTVSNYIVTEDRNALPAIKKQSAELINTYTALDLAKDISMANTANEELQGLIEQFESVQETITRLKAESDAYKAKQGSLASYSNIVSNNENQLIKVMATIDKGNRLRSRAAIIEELETIRVMMNNCKEFKQKLELNHSEAKQYQQIIERNQNLRLQIANSQKQFDERKQLITTMVHEKSALQAKIGDLTKFESLVNRASLDALDQVIQDVNDKAGSYIDSFLGGDISVVFSTVKENKKNKKIEKIQLDITEHGLAVHKISELSTGQNTKVGLSFCLAASLVFHSPVLLLDESLRGLDPASFETCIAAIKEIAQDKLVIVLEHSAFAGFFDGIITL